MPSKHQITIIVGSIFVVGSILNFVLATNEDIQSISIPVGFIGLITLWIGIHNARYAKLASSNKDINKDVNKNVGESMSRIILICSKAEMNSYNFQMPLKKIVNTYQYHKKAPPHTIRYFINLKITLPNINDEMMCNMFIWTGLMANGIKQPDNMSWHVESYKEGGYEFIVFDIKCS